jgi:predicted nuclease of predicted toxin-antitoxin system
LAAFFADQNFPQQVVAALRALSHDVLTAHEAGLANQRVRDEEILSEATRLRRMVLTLNRWEFVRLHAAHTRVNRPAR